MEPHFSNTMGAMSALNVKVPCGRGAYAGGAGGSAGGSRSMTGVAVLSTFSVVRSGGESQPESNAPPTRTVKRITARSRPRAQFSKGRRGCERVDIGDRRGNRELPCQCRESLRIGQAIGKPHPDGGPKGFPTHGVRSVRAADPISRFRVISPAKLRSKPPRGRCGPRGTRPRARGNSTFCSRARGSNPARSSVSDRCRPARPDRVRFAR